jgi:hypothetical protein
MRCGGIIIFGFYCLVCVAICWIVSGREAPGADEPPTIKYPKDNPGPEAPDLWLM